MPDPLASIVINAPGSKGLNTQEEYASLDLQWATELTNAEFDTQGRVVRRDGFIPQTTTGSPGDVDMEQLHCWEDETSTVVISAADAKLYYGTTTLTAITPATPPTNNNWQFQNWIDSAGNTKIVAWQSGETPIVSTVTGTTPAQFVIITAADGTLPTGNCCLVAFGRIWASDSDGTTLKYSGLQDETKWGSAGAGSVDTLEYWPTGVDYITALAVWEDYLIVFGKRNILIYDSPEDTANFPVLIDTVEGVGCVSRDSVQDIGTDILFLSETGVRSLRRTIETEKNPLQEIGVQVRDDLISYISGNEDTIRSAFNQKKGFYLLIIPATGDHVGFMFDLKSSSVKDLFGRQMFDTENVRVSKWSGQWNPHSVAYGRDGNMYYGVRNNDDDATVSIHSGNKDRNFSNITLTYATPWVDLSGSPEEGGSSMGSFLKILKSVAIYVVGGSGTFVNLQARYDYQTGGKTHSGRFFIPGSQAVSSEWGDASPTATEWGISEWGFTITNQVDRYTAQLSGSGELFKLRITNSTSGSNFGLHRLVFFFKRGRLAR